MPTCHGEAGGRIDEQREEPVVEGDVKLEGRLNDEQAARHDEDHVKHGQGNQKLVK